MCIDVALLLLFPLIFPCIERFTRLSFCVFQGPANKNSVCATCHGSFHDCPGHFGYLKLTLPVFNVGYMGTIIDTLKCICKVRMFFPPYFEVVIVS
jgi:hypothetical protein